jgi:hypothetical protein
MQDTCVSVNLTQVPDSTTPLHIVLWKGAGRDDQVKSLLERISVLENMVNSLLESRKTSPWFPAHLRPTPTGIEVMSRRESMGGESDIGTVLSQIVRPTEDDIRSVTIVSPAPAHAEPAIAVLKMEGVRDEDEAEGEMVVEEGEAEGEAEEGEAEGEVVVEEAVEEVVVEEAEVVVEEADAEGEEVVVEEADAEEEVVEEAEAEAEAEFDGGQEFTLEEEIVEYKEVEWKGHTYYVDGQGEAYEMDPDGDLNESPIGLWREATQKLVRYTKPTL